MSKILAVSAIFVGRDMCLFNFQHFAALNLLFKSTVGKVFVCLNNLLESYGGNQITCCGKVAFLEAFIFACHIALQK